MPKELNQSISEEERKLFDAIGDYFIDHPEAPSGALLEAVDYVSNYLGDIAMGRKYEPEELKEAFPSVFSQALTARDKELREKIEKIDVEGGGSGRRLKAQILSLLEEK